MSEDSQPSIEMPTIVSIEDIIKLLINHFEIKEGFYILNFEMEMAAGQMPLPSNHEVGKPSLHFAFTGFSLQSVPENVPNAVDASKVYSQDLGG